MQYMRKGKRKRKPPSQCKQAFAQSSETTKTENLSVLETKQKGTAQMLQTFRNPHLLKTTAGFRRKGLFFNSQFFIQRVSFQTNMLNIFLKQNLSYFLFGPSLKNSETPFMLRKNLRSMGKKKRTCCLFKKKERIPVGSSRQWKCNPNWRSGGNSSWNIMYSLKTLSCFFVFF